MATQEAIRAVAGLGNPGLSYAHTRHNAGFWFVDALAERYGAQFRSHRKLHGESAVIQVAGIDLHLLKPATYVNRSGLALQALSYYYKLTPAQILVAHDELDLPPGVVRLKRDGGHSGHNGLRDIITHLGSQFCRLRLGIGHPGDRAKVVDFVLNVPSREERLLINEAITDACETFAMLPAGAFDKAMQTLNSRQPSSLE